ncbi:MAG: TRAP transporter permease [Deltaproteobacteria bacterium]|nr:TRAP transporter permease [Deltaproteobacteria bacterium]
MSTQESKVQDIFESPMRKNLGSLSSIVRVAAAAMSLLHLYTAAFGTFQAMIQRSMHLIFAIPLIFILYPASKKQKDEIRLFDIFLVLLSIGAYGWIMLQYESRLAIRLPYVDPLNVYDYIFGILAILLVLEANRRTMGWPLVIITVCAIIFNFIGPYIPGPFAHSSCTLEYFIDHVYLNTEGLFSSITGISATYVIIFIIFGAFLDVSNMAAFFLNLCNALTGKYPGGAAKTAVLSSAMLGSISGSGVANVVTTGAFTIPMMKKTGYSAEEAGAIETAASCGGQMLPPLMGAGAFVMAEFTGVPYIDIVKVSIVPAILYYLMVYWNVHLAAIRRGLTGLSPENIPNLWQVMKSGGHLLIPIAALVILMLRGYTPFYVGAITIALVVIIGHFKKNTRFNFQKLFRALELGAERSISMASAAACAGLILGVVSQTGFGIRMSSLILSISQNNLFLTLILVGIVSYILGMGLTVVTAYIIAAVLAVPALVELGVPVLAAHLIIFWFSQTSNVSPPVCLAAYAAAAISGGNPMKTGFTAFKYSLGMILIPFLFVYTPFVFLSYKTTVLSYVWYTLTTAIGLAFTVFAIEGFVKKPLGALERLLVASIAIMLYLPWTYLKVAGIILLPLFYYFHLRQKKTAL